MTRYIVAPILGAAVIGLAGAVAWQARATAPVAPITSTQLPASGATIKVHVTGAVQSPGVYVLSVGDRVAEAIRAAGGTTTEADDMMINLAQRVHDEQRLDVPTRAPASVPPLATSVNPVTGVGPTGNAATPPRASSSASTQPGTDAELNALLAPTLNPEGGARVNVNQASVAQLEKLPGIGAVSAKKLATWRIDNGPIRSVADLRAAGLTAAVLRKALPYLAIR
jgi:competence protein ComEA